MIREAKMSEAIEVYRVPGPISTDPRDEAFYKAFHARGWSWSTGKGVVALPCGTIANEGDWILVEASGDCSVHEREPGSRP